MSDIRIVTKTDKLKKHAQVLAKQTGLVFCKESEPDTGIILQVSECTDSPGYHLALIQTGKNASGPVTTEFVSGAARHRRLYGDGRNQALARAVGMKRGVIPKILDATAGLGRDAFVLACLGCQVDLLERSPVIHALLENGLLRAASNPSTKEIVCNRMRLIHTDTIQHLRDIGKNQLPDVIYMDPMYPDRTKSALVKKEMRLFKKVIGDDLDAGDLLSIALENSVKRVVVKRPRQAPNIAGLEPFTMIQTKNTRYDIYINLD